METVTPRQSKYCTPIKDALVAAGHASNADLLKSLQSFYPELSPTTVHRATARMAARGEIGVAPPDHQGAMRYDANILPHDHFACTSCSTVRDADVVNAVVPTLESQLDGCHISGRLIIYGTCHACTAKQGGKQ